VNPRNAVCFLAAFLIASAPLALAQGTYTQIDPPGSLLTHATGINNVGDIVGFYYDVVGAHGFVLNGDVYTTVNLKGQATSFGGVNDLRQVVGVSKTGFVYDLNTQEFKTIIDPITQQQTTPTCINNAISSQAILMRHSDSEAAILLAVAVTSPDTTSLSLTKNSLQKPMTMMIRYSTPPTRA
jgi:hypothetical protein